jgi:hypothetical protein
MYLEKVPSEELQKLNNQWTQDESPSNSFGFFRRRSPPPKHTESTPDTSDLPVVPYVIPIVHHLNIAELNRTLPKKEDVDIAKLALIRSNLNSVVEKRKLSVDKLLPGKLTLEDLQKYAIAIQNKLQTPNILNASNAAKLLELSSNLLKMKEGEGGRSTKTKVSFTKDGSQHTRTVHSNKRGTKCVTYKGAEILVSKLKGKRIL